MKTLTTKILVGIALCMGTTNVFSQPPNDLIANAIDLAMEAVPYQANVMFSNATNTNDHTPAAGCGVSQPGVWYKFTATKNGNIGAGITVPSDAEVIFYEGPATGVTSGMQLTFVNQATNPCGGATNIASIQATTGVTYYIYMNNQVDSDVLINATGVFAPPANDLIENAHSLNNITQYTKNGIHFLMATNTNDGGQTNCSTNDVPGIWYKFTATTNGQVIAGISSLASESALVFFSAPNENATSGTDLTYVSQASNPCGSDNLTSINATAGTTYYIFVWQEESPFADVSINLSDIMSTQNHVLEGFEFYPNPVNNTLNLNARGNIDKVNIYNLSGEKIYNEKIGMKEFQLNLGMLSPGLYIMEVLSEGITARYKLIKK
ncbi:MAG TPA: T9SS type A sorting domain-containing protein [Flavobacteriaceae bacterium]|nr:T9SS type A sorting domain-containing protein [Flavobacteriaceae bacterium]